MSQKTPAPQHVRYLPCTSCSALQRTAALCPFVCKMFAMFCVAALALVAVQGARPNRELSMLMPLSEGASEAKETPEEKVTKWASKKRFSGPCSFWDADDVDPNGKDPKCKCHREGTSTLTAACTLDFILAGSDFDPASISLHRVPELWAEECRCLSWKERKPEELPDENSELIRVKAVEFCAKVFEPVQRFSEARMDDPVFREVYRRNSVESLDPAVCSKALEDDQKEDILGKRTNKAWQHALKQVCHEECEDLVKEVRESSHDIVTQVFWRRQMSFGEMCSHLVVQRVEARLMGCCAESCGWNGKTCARWRFLNRKDQRAWKAECCVEKNIVMGSNREQMCQSILQHDAAVKYAGTDLDPKKEDGSKDGTLSTVIGEDEELVWTEKGVASPLGIVGWGRVGRVPDKSFLRIQPLSIKEGIDLEYWKPQKKTGVSLLQVEEVRRMGSQCESDYFQRMGRASQLNEGQWSHWSEPARRCMNGPVQKTDPKNCLEKITYNGIVMKGDAIQWYAFEYTDKGVACFVVSKRRPCKRITRNRLGKKDPMDPLWFWKHA